MTETTAMRREAPWMAGIRAARGNVVPGLIVQGIMLAVVVAYYFYPPTTGWLDAAAQVKARWGYVYSAVAAVIAGALLPELMRVIVFQKGKVERRNGRNLLYTVPFWGFMAITVDVLYRLQGIWFGTEVTFAVVAKKVIVDQLIYSSLISCPLTVWFYDFKNHGQNATRPAEFLTMGHYRDQVVPVMFANWGVWIPVVTILYSLPPLLQIPMYILALTLWVMIYTWMSEQPRK